MKRMKRLIALLCVLVFALAATYLAPKLFNDKDSTTEQKGDFALTGRNKDDITGLAWKKGDAEKAFVYENGVWIMAEDALFPVDQEKLSSLLDKAVAIKASRKIENISSYADYGLENPAFLLTVTWKDGAITEYGLGDKTPFNDGYYLSSSDESGLVYVTDSDFSTAFNKDINDFAVMETLPEIGTVVKMQVGSDFSAEYRQETTLIDESVSWFDTNTGFPLDTKSMETLISDAVALTWEAIVNSFSDTEALTNMNLTDDQAVWVILTDDQGRERTLLIGNQSEDGAYFARLKDSSTVYTLSGSCDNVVKAAADSLYSLSVAPADFEEISDITFTLDGRTICVQRVTTALSATDGEAAESTELFVNGQSTQSSAAKDAWKLVSDLKASGYVTDEVKKNAVLTISLTHINGRSETITIYEESVNQYILTLSDGREMLISADKADKIIRYVKGI